MITRVGSGVRAAGAVGGAGGRTGGGGGAAGRGGIPAEGVVGTGGLGIGGRARFAPGGGGRTGPDEGDGIGGRPVGDGFTGAAGGVGADDTTRLGSSGRRLPGGFGGKFSRTSARASSVAAPPFDVDGRGGRVIRTVSFLGSFGSLIVEISSAAKFR
ncbi:MAG: hypothetical protein ACJ8KX_09855 [Chthoniobacterales bacterium]